MEELGERLILQALATTTSCKHAFQSAYFAAHRGRLEGIEEVDGDNFEEIEREELTRVAIKKASEQLSSANERRTKKRGKKKKSRNR